MKVVILAGGMGTRLSEETTVRPKPMVEIGSERILWNIMKIYSSQGFNDFIICAGYKKNMIKDYFVSYLRNHIDIEINFRGNDVKMLNEHKEEWKVKIIDTGLSTMTGGRIKRIEKYIHEDDFMLTYGDSLSDINLKVLIESHRKSGKFLTVTAVQPKGRFGVLSIDKGEVLDITEKPSGDGMWINGKYVRECRENIFKGLHIVFVESGGKGDFYFNYEHNCNVGIKKAMEYNPKWIVISNDDMEKVDDIKKLTEKLMSLPYVNPHPIYSEDRKNSTNVVKLGSSTFIRNSLYYIATRYTRNIISFERKFGIRCLVALSSFPYNLFFRVKHIFPAIGDFAICSSELFKLHPVPFDETFINGGGDIDFLLSIYLKSHTYSAINFKFKSIGGGVLGKKGRMLKDVLNLSYLNHKIDKLCLSKQFNED